MLQYMADRLVSKGGKQYDFSDDPALWKVWGGAVA